MNEPYFYENCLLEALKVVSIARSYYNLIKYLSMFNVKREIVE